MYYCKNCGEPYMTDEAVMCIKCGVAKGQGNNYCHNCGKPLAPDAAVCLNCGVANKQAPAPDAKSKLVAGLLVFFWVHSVFIILSWLHRKSNHTACAYHCWIYSLLCCSWYFPGYRYMDLESGRGYYDPDRQDQCRW